MGRVRLDDGWRAWTGRVFLPRGAYVRAITKGRQGSGGGAPVVVNMNITAPNPAAFQQSRIR